MSKLTKRGRNVFRRTFCTPLTLHRLAFYTAATFIFVGGNFIGAAIAHHPANALWGSGGWMLSSSGLVIIIKATCR